MPMTDAMNGPTPPRPDTGADASELLPQRPDAGRGGAGAAPPPATWKPIEALPVGLID